MREFVDCFFVLVNAINCHGQVCVQSGTKSIYYPHILASEGHKPLLCPQKAVSYQIAHFLRAHL